MSRENCFNDGKSYNDILYLVVALLLDRAINKFE